jgi:hypothetical protein
MREYVKGVWVRKRRDGFHFIVMDNLNKTVFNNDPLILLDGVPVFDVNKIMELNPLNIKTIDVLTRKYFMGNQTFEGVVSYMSYTGELSYQKINPKSVQLNYEGLQEQLEFYSPRYENDTQLKSRLPDQRTALQWIPSVYAKSGKASLNFFTSDITGNFVISVQGITQNGLPVFQSSNFTVKATQQ